MSWCPEVTLGGDGESAVSSQSPSSGSLARSAQPARVTQPGLQTVINFRGCVCIPAAQPGRWLLSTGQAHACTPPLPCAYTHPHTHMSTHGNLPTTCVHFTQPHIYSQSHVIVLTKEREEKTHSSVLIFTPPLHVGPPGPAWGLFD